MLIPTMQPMHSGRVCYNQENKKIQDILFFLKSWTVYTAHCLALTLVGAKHKSDFQVHLDIQNFMLVLISNLHVLKKNLPYISDIQVDLGVLSFAPTSVKTKQCALVCH